MRPLFRFGLVLLLASLAPPAPAATYVMDWSTIDGGGTVHAAAGAYDWAGSQGQPDASVPVTGGSYAWTGGFWFLGAATLDVPSETSAPQPTFAVRAAMPTPSYGRASIRFRLPQAREVRVRVVDAAGHAVRELLAGSLPAGEHEVSWDGHDARGTAASPGLYFVLVDAGTWRGSTRLVWLPTTGGER